MDDRRTAALLGAGRAALGAAVLLAPEAVTSHWLGDENASHPAVRYLARSVGARDLALGVLALCTLSNAAVASQVQAACAASDAVDALATVAVSKRLPLVGAVGTVTVAGAAAVAGFGLSRRLGRA
jgi:hypothetical protein